MNRSEYLSTGAILTARRGVDLPQSRLTPGIVREIRINRHGMTAKEQAAVYGVHFRTIQKVRYYDTWRHV